MKKPHTVLIFITAIFLSFIIGTYIGRNTSNDYITLSSSGSNSESGNPLSADPDDVFFQTSSDTTGRININTATKEQLAMLPGIGDVLAERIITYRNVNGQFSTTEELINVEGIGEGKMKEILEYITVGG